jgi:hypothetical protein
LVVTGIFFSGFWEGFMMLRASLSRLVAICGAVALFAWCSSAYAESVGDRGNLNVTPVADGAITVDGDPSDWDLGSYTDNMEAPDFPGGQDPWTDSGDHIVFNKAKIGHFNGTNTGTGFINDATDGSDMTGALYFAYDSNALYILEVRADQAIFDTEGACANWGNDGFEIFLDTQNDSVGCASSTFPSFNEVAPWADDHQLTWGVNSSFASDARLHYERGGENTTLDCFDPAVPGDGSLRDHLDTAFPGGSEFTTRYADIGDVTTSIGGTNVSGMAGYIMECGVPFNFDANDTFNPSRVMGFAGFWRDRDPAPGTGFDWAYWGQQTDTDCSGGALNSFNPETWGTLTFATEPRGSLTIPRWTGAPITIDGDASDWPLASFTNAAVLPDAPGAVSAVGTGVDGDHLVFDKAKIGHFNGTNTATGFINDATDGSDMSSEIYMMYDASGLYILEVRLDNAIFDTEGACANWGNDGFEFFFDSANDSSNCASSAFPSFNESGENVDDHQLTWGVNSSFATDARLHYERGGENTKLDCFDPAVPGDGSLRDALDTAFPAGSEVTTRHADMSAVVASIGGVATAGVPGYVMECGVPWNFDVGSTFNADESMGFAMFWRDRDPAPGTGFDWAYYYQQTDTNCAGGAANVSFDTSTWGTLNFGGPLRGPRGNIEVRPFAGITVDGDLADWPLDQFTTAAVMPADVLTSITVDSDGDHLIFDKSLVGHFNGTNTATGFINDATDGSDMSSEVYMVYSDSALYILEVRLDNAIFDTEGACANWGNDGFEMFFDTNNDSNNCASSSFPSFNESGENVDDHQLTWGVNSSFATDARLHYERGGENTTLDCFDPAVPGDGSLRDALDTAFPAGSEVTTRHADMSAVIASIGGVDTTGLPGYVLECGVPFDFDAANSFNPAANSVMGWSMFWRDRDPAPGTGFDWGYYHQQVETNCAGGDVNASFHTSSWGTMTFSSRGFLVDPVNTIEVRPLDGPGAPAIVIDGDASEWPLEQFDDPAVLTDSTGVKAVTGQDGGDHIIFDKAKIGHFNGTNTATGFINDATDGSDMASAIYMVYDATGLYILEVRADNAIFDTEGACANWGNDGFEMFFDVRNDSSNCASDSFPSFNESGVNVDDHQLTWGVNSSFATDARAHYERGGQNTTLDCFDPAVPGDGTFRDALDTAFPGGSEVTVRHADLSAAVPASIIAAIGAPAGAAGYVMEAGLPWNWDTTAEFNPTDSNTMGWTAFWRDRDPAPGTGFDWGYYHQMTDTNCAGGQANVSFDTANWGDITFSDRSFTFGSNIKPGDANQDGVVDLSDPIAFLGSYFNGVALPGDNCLQVSTGGTPDLQFTATGIQVLDWNGDSLLDISDAVGSLNFQFSTGAAHAAGVTCILITGQPDCSESCTP